MVVAKPIKVDEILKKEILKKEEKKGYFSERFKKIENKVKTSLKNQKTDEALTNITIGALVLNSSDIHYDTFEKYVVIRFRIDGILVDIFRLSNKEYKQILERLKYSSSLKLNIVNIPQEGKYTVNIDDKKIDVRVATLPVGDYENIVCRILDNTNKIINFEKLGFFWTTKRMLERAISKKNGLILITGPTGSGKTTTLYTIMTELNTRDKKIITLEDPIEYRLDGIIQSEVNEKIGFTFETGLRAILRQDPDMIMVGEIRDKQTLETANQASLTGHLVLSTLHTKSAAETLDRIINMGIQPYILASALNTIIAQRLVRKICTSCKKEKERTPLEISIIGNMMKEIGMSNISLKNIKLYEGKGCEKCNNSGYSGRIGIYEIISLDNDLRDLIREGATAEKIIKKAREGDLITMKEDGILKAIKGFTTIEEILRIL